MDGSAKVFLDSINKVGLKFSDQPIKIIKINKEIVFKEEENLYLLISLMLQVI